jgi:hypothetical protein
VCVCVLGGVGGGGRCESVVFVCRNAYADVSWRNRDNRSVAEDESRRPELNLYAANETSMLRTTKQGQPIGGARRVTKTRVDRVTKSPQGPLIVLL